MTETRIGSDYIKFEKSQNNQFNRHLYKAWPQVVSRIKFVCPEKEIKAFPFPNYSNVFKILPFFFKILLISHHNLSIYKNYICSSQQSI